MNFSGPTHIRPMMAYYMPLLLTLILLTGLFYAACNCIAAYAASVDEIVHNYVTE